MINLLAPDQLCVSSDPLLSVVEEQLVTEYHGRLGCPVLTCNIGIAAVAQLPLEACNCRGTACHGTAPERRKFFLKAAHVMQCVMFSCSQAEPPS